jgi:hypothetical protein
MRACRTKPAFLLRLMLLSTLTPWLPSCCWLAFRLRLASAAACSAQQQQPRPPHMPPLVASNGLLMTCHFRRGTVQSQISYSIQHAGPAQHRILLPHIQYLNTTATISRTACMQGQPNLQQDPKFSSTAASPPFGSKHSVAAICGTSMLEQDWRSCDNHHQIEFGTFKSAAQLAMPLQGHTAGRGCNLLRCCRRH